MKNIFILLVLTFVLFSCDNGDMGDETDKDYYSLIGTWEAEGDYYSSGMGENRNYKSTLIFHNDTEYTGISHYRKVGTTEWKNDGESRGTYTYNEKNITYTVKYYYNNGSVSSEYSGTFTYKFTDKNTLVTGSIDLPHDAGSPVYKKKKN